MDSVVLDLLRQLYFYSTFETHRQFKVLYIGKEKAFRRCSKAISNTKREWNQLKGNSTGLQHCWIHYGQFRNKWSKPTQQTFENPMPTLPTMQHSCWVTALEAIYQITCSFLMTYWKLYPTFALPKTCKHMLICKIFGVTLQSKLNTRDEIKH